MQVPSVQVMKIMAVADKPLFEEVMNSIGLPVLGHVNPDPLEKSAQPETVNSIAAGITEGIHDPVELPPELEAIKNMAEALGFIIGLDDGLQQ